MSSKRITEREFFTCEAVELAEKLIGKVICNRAAGKILRFRIIETEAYGKNDTACHSNKYKSGNGVVSQNMIGGTLYVHYNNKDKPGSMFDVVANKVGVGEGVLIRGGINLENPNEEYLSKPISSYPMKPFPHFHWFAIEGKRPNISENFIREEIKEQNVDSSIKSKEKKSIDEIKPKENIGFFKDSIENNGTV